MSTQQEKFTEIANEIREKTGESTLIKPSDFASKIKDVYEVGKRDGVAEIPNGDEVAF